MVRESRVRVLLIEDDPLVRIELVDQLCERGFDADGLANAEDALVLLGAGQVPDVLVTDINLGPGLNGLDLAGTAQSRHPDVGVVFITGEDRLPEGHGLGPHEQLLRKPFTTASLVASIRRAVEEG